MDELNYILKSLENKSLQELLKKYNDLKISYLDLYSYGLEYFFFEENMVRYVHTSVAIEGNTFTYEETESFLKTGRTIKNKTLEEHIDIKNLNSAYKEILALAKKDNLQKVDEKLIFHIYGIIVDDIAPRYKTQNNYTKLKTGEIHMYPSPPKSIKMMDQFLNKDFPIIEQNIDNDLIKSLYLTYMISTIHPFQDGNGRLARIIMQYYLLSKKEISFYINNNNRQEYIDALTNTRRENDLYYIFEFGIGQSIQQLQQKMGVIKKKIIWN